MLRTAASFHTQLFDSRVVSRILLLGPHLPLLMHCLVTFPGLLQGSSSCLSPLSLICLPSVEISLPALHDVAYFGFISAISVAGTTVLRCFMVALINRAQIILNNKYFQPYLITMLICMGFCMTLFVFCKLPFFHCHVIGFHIRCFLFLFCVLCMSSSSCVLLRLSTPVFVSFLPFHCVHQCLISEQVPVYLGLCLFLKLLYVSMGAQFHERPPDPTSFARLHGWRKV